MSELFSKYKCGRIVKNDEKLLFELLKEILDNGNDFKKYENDIREHKNFFIIKKNKRNGEIIR